MNETARRPAEILWNESPPPGGGVSGHARTVGIVLDLQPAQVTLCSSHYIDANTTAPPGGIIISKAKFSKGKWLDDGKAFELPKTEPDDKEGSLSSEDAPNPMSSAEEAARVGAAEAGFAYSERHDPPDVSEDKAPAGG